ncbi:hypothetical protein ABT150_23695 [Streptomyces mirabilis]|uniref:hypothetical protein n=1 Tax=Streptomyces mirabilis TaxID=68239 RepID=UPI0033263DE2
MADCTRFDCTDYDPCPACLEEARKAGLFPVAELAVIEELAATHKRQEQATTGPRCGNNPNVRLSEGDQKAVDEFKSYLKRRRAGGPPERNPFSAEEERSR